MHRNIFHGSLQVVLSLEFTQFNTEQVDRREHLTLEKGYCFYLGKPLKINIYKASFVEIPMTQLRGSRGSKYCRLD